MGFITKDCMVMGATHNTLCSEVENPQHSIPSDIENALAVRLENGAFVWTMPPGIAFGAFDLRTRGRGIDYANVDRWPSIAHWALTTGVYKHICGSKGMYQQEVHVYMLELVAAINDALALLEVECDERDCVGCGKRFVSERKKRYCSLSCNKKHHAWKKLQTKLLTAEASHA